jgi:hypothetical protein
MTIPGLDMVVALAMKAAIGEDVDASLVIAHEASPWIIQPKVRSTTQRRGRTSKPFWLSDRRITSMTKSR